MEANRFQPSAGVVRTPERHSNPALADDSDAVPAEVRLQAVWASDDSQVREAQRLRWRVFVQETGARLSPVPGTPHGLDVDPYDSHCEHLLVQTVEADGAPGRVVGTYRVLTPAAARRAGGLYSDNEFDLSRLDRLRPRIAELGRSCTDPEFRSGGVILLLWGALAEFMGRNGLDITVGCASVPMQDGGHCAASLWNRLRREHLAAPEFAARPMIVPVKCQLDGAGNCIDLDGNGSFDGYADSVQQAPTTLVHDAHRAGLFVHEYTFRNEKGYYNLPFDVAGDPVKEYLRHFRLGVDGVFSDAPDTALQARSLLARPSSDR